MGTTKSWFYGGHEILTPSSGPVRLSEQRGRVKVLDPSAASIEIRLPPTSEIPYAGFSVLLLVNINDTNALNIRNQSGGTTDILGGTTLGTNQMAKVGLVDRSTEDGKWVLRITNINEAVGPLPDYMMTAGGAGSPAITATRLFSPNLETFSSGSTSIDKLYPNGFRDAAFAYYQGDRVTDLASLDEYVFNTWTGRTSAGTNRRDGDCVADISGKGVIYFEQVGGAPLGPVEEYQRVGDTWTTLNSGFQGGSDEADHMSARGRGAFGYIVMGTAVASGNEFQKHDRVLDTYSAMLEIAGEHPREAVSLFIMGATDLHQAGGSTSTTETKAHNKFDLDLETAWTSTVALPTTGQGIRGASAAAYPTNNKLALFWHGLWDQGSEFKTLKWDDVTALWLTGVGDPPDSGNGQAFMHKNNTTVPQV